ncbi:MAG: glycosyltransferase [Pseudobutyrivibrio sp.]|nr:glycosyltransferase [Pseudobutyrivibrio sp.]
MNTKEKTKLLTIGLLCCGRADTTERCLKSLLPIREAVDSEIQVVDTGCSKETRAIVDKYADEVFEFKWIGDFAAARNFQLDQANGQMFLFIDDDEYFLDTENIIKFFNEEDCLSYNIGGYYQRNYLQLDGKEYKDVEVVRMCSVTPQTHFIGKVHEYIEPSYGNAIFLDARAGHFGYAYASPEDNFKHSMRNIPLLKDMMDEMPENLRWQYQLCQEYRAIKYYDELMEICLDGMKKTEDDSLEDAIRYRGTFVCGLAIVYEAQSKWDDLIALYEELEKDKRLMDMPRAMVLAYAAKAFFLKRDNKKCQQLCNLYLKIYDMLADKPGECFLQTGIFVNEAFDYFNYSNILCYNMASGLREGDYGPLTKYYRKLKMDGPVVRVNRGFLIEILDKCAEFGHKKEIHDVLKRYLASKAFRVIFQSEIDGDFLKYDINALDKIRSAMKDTPAQTEMELYMDLRMIEKAASNPDNIRGFYELIEVINDYVRTANAWFDSRDLSDDARDRQDFEEIKLSDILDSFLQSADGEKPTEALVALRDAIGLRPAMDASLAQLSKLYANHLDIIRARQADEAKFDQMYALEQQVRQQIAQLEQSGHTADARTTANQLEAILKQSYGLTSLLE